MTDTAHGGTGPTPNSTLAGTDAELTAVKRVRRLRPVPRLVHRHSIHGPMLPVPLADMPLWNRRIRDWMAA